MTTKNIVPRANNEGGIGTAAKNWLAGYFAGLSVGASGINELTLTKAATGFTITGGTVSKTLTMNDTFNVSTQLAATAANAAAIDTISGSLSSEIDSDISAHSASGDHDGRYYTENEIDTISGSLDDKIDGKDNYDYWTFAVDGVSKDNITSNDVFDIVGGDNITVTRSAEDQITISGSAGEGSSNHSELNQLDYASAGHTGFAESSHNHDSSYYTEAEVDTISGSLSDEIDGDITTHSSDTTSIHGITDTSDLGLKSGNVNQFNDITSAGANIEDAVTKKHNESHTITSHSDITDATGANIEELTGGGNTTLHNHGATYYTEAEVDTISGSLSDEIDSDISTHSSSGDHDGRYYTETEVDSEIATFSGTIDHDTINNTHDLTTDIDHGSISGLDDDDHSAIYYNKTAVDGKWTTWSGTIDHDTIINTHDLTTDIDHNQLTNYAVGQHRIIDDSGFGSTDLWSAEKINTMSGTLSTEVDTDISTHSSDTTSVHGITDTSDLGLISGNVNQFNDITSAGADIEDAVTKRHNESHTITSHSDITDATGAEIETLTGGGDTTLHDHDGISENTAARHAESHTITSHSDITDATGAQIEELTGGGNTTLHNHGDTYYTETEVDAAFVTFSGTIDHDTIVNTHNLTTDIDHNELTNYAVGQHRIINDSGTSATELWSASKINTELGNKDDYDYWTFAVDGVSKDNITSGDVFDIVGGDNITVTRSAEDQITISGSAGGSANHSELNQLDYASAGHTGFTSSATFNDHSARHEPDSGTDALSTMAPDELAGVQAEGEGAETAFARSDHQHEINHAITDNHLVTIDSADVGAGEYAKFTSAGLESRTSADVLSDLSSEAESEFDWGQQTLSNVGTIELKDTGTIGSTSAPGVLAISAGGVITLTVQGIADNQVLTVDHAAAADDDYARFTSNGLEGRDATEVRSDLSLYTQSEVDSEIATFSGTIDHNTILNVQGGTTNEYYHLTANEEAKISATATTLTLGTSSNKVVVDDGGDRVYVVVDGIACLDVNADTQYYMMGEPSHSAIEINAGAEDNVELISDNNTILSADATKVDITTDLTVSGTVDGVDIATFKTGYDAHDHDGDYYTQAEVDTISGSLSTEIDTDISTHNTDSTSVHGITDTSALATTDANIVDHTIVRGHGGAKIVQDTGITIDDSDVMTLPASSAIVCPEKLVIPLNEPSSLVNGCIWIV